MDLIIWRHAEAEDERDGLDDLQRALTPRGEKQAARMAQWLDLYLPDNARILCSPALRCEQTVLALGRKYKVLGGLFGIGCSASLIEMMRQRRRLSLKVRCIHSFDGSRHPRMQPLPARRRKGFR